MAIDRKKMPCNVIANYVKGWKKLQEQKMIVAALETAVRILKGMKGQLVNRDIRIAAPEVLPDETLLAEIKLLASQLGMVWENYHKSIKRDEPKAA